MLAYLNAISMTPVQRTRGWYLLFTLLQVPYGTGALHVVSCAVNCTSASCRQAGSELVGALDGIVVDAVGRLLAGQHFTEIGILGLTHHFFLVRIALQIFLECTLLDEGRCAAVEAGIRGVIGNRLAFQTKVGVDGQEERVYPTVLNRCISVYY